MLATLLALTLLIESAMVQAETPAPPPEAPPVAVSEPDPPMVGAAEFERRVIGYGGFVDYLFVDSQPFRDYLRANPGGRTLSRMLGTKSPMECQSATLVESKAGNLLCAYSAGSSVQGSDAAIWLSRFARREWSEPERIAKLDEQPHASPVLFRDPQHAIYLFFKLGEPASWNTYWMQSEDGGRTWEDALELVPGDKGGRGPVRNKPIILSDGTWLAPASTERGDREQGAWKAFVDRSADEGKTWERSADFAVDPALIPGAGTIQPTLWESAPNQIHALLRTSGGFVGRSDSTDGGLTWSPVTPSSVKNNNSAIDTLRFEDGRLLLVYNPARKDVGPKSPLTLALSTDNGVTWRNVASLEADAADFVQPSIIRTKLGIAVAYTWKGERIRVWQIPLRAFDPAKRSG